MSLHLRSTERVHAAVVSWRYLAHRFSFLAFLALALGLLVLSRTQPVLVDHLRLHVLDTLAPVLDVLAKPGVALANAGRRASAYLQLRSENERLRAENARLQQWQNAAIALQSENKELKALLHYQPEPQHAYISARVIADTGGPFVRSLVITAGRTDGVREGMAAMTGEGLIGRVIEVGDWSSRLLLITDLNSRLPVTMADSGDHAILAGDNTPHPKLLYLPQDATLKEGARLLTSGHGGVFPPNLPVAVVTNAAHGQATVTPLADLSRINQVRLIDFNLKGGAFNPMTRTVEAGSER